MLSYPLTDCSHCSVLCSCMQVLGIQRQLPIMCSYSQSLLNHLDLGGYHEFRVVRQPGTILGLGCLHSFGHRNCCVLPAPVLSPSLYFWARKSFCFAENLAAFCLCFRAHPICRVGSCAAQDISARDTDDDCNDPILMLVFLWTVNFTQSLTVVFPSSLLWTRISRWR